MRATVKGVGGLGAGIGSGIALCALFLGAMPAFAGVGGGVVPHYESPVNVGESYPAFITITNTSDGDNETEFVKVTNVVHTPSCAATSGLGICNTTDPGVFSISNPVGSLSCAANTFNVSAPAAGTGEVTFTSPTDVILGRADGIGGVDSRCRISFTVTVLKTATPGPTTLPLGRAQLQGVTSLLIGQASGATITTVTAPTLQVAKTPDGQTINAGDTATFTIVVSNTGTGTAKTVTLSDALPAGDGIIWTTATAGCTTSGLNLSCNLGDIAASGSSTVVVSGKTSYQACTWMPNPAAIASAANAASKQDDGVITCLRPALQVVKTPDGQTINAGDTATFTIVVSNSGTGTAKGVTLNDALPVGDGVTWTTATAGCTTSGLNLSCTLGDIAAGGSTTVVVSAKTSYQACTWMPNPAAIASATNGPSAQDDGVITCLRPALQVVKTPDGQTINAGDTATFTIVVSNSGPGTAKGVTLSDVLPVGDGITWTTATAGCTTSGLNLSCTLGDIAAGGSTTVVVSGKTSYQACTWMPNPAAIASAANAPSAQDDGVITCVRPALHVVKTPDGQTINAGDTATFTIVVSNTGTGTAKSVTLSDVLPAGDGVAWTTATAGCTTSGLNLSCTLGDIAAGGSTTVVVSAKTSYQACTWMPNPAAVASAANAPSAQDDGVITCVRPALHVVKTPDGQTINAGDTATFTIVVSNSGPGTAKGVTLNDALPSGGGLAWTTTTAGCTTSGLNLSCTLGDIAAGGSTTVVVRAKTSVAACTTMPNPAAIASATNAPSAQDDGVITCVTPPTGLIAPTETNCSEYANGTAPALGQINYSVSGGNIDQGINPGVFFYFTKITTTTTNQVVTVSESHTGTVANFQVQQGQANLYTANCSSSTGGTLIAGDTGATWTIANPGTYIIGIKYSTKSIADTPAPVPHNITYTFTTSLGPLTSGSVLLTDNKAAKVIAPRSQTTSSPGAFSCSNFAPVECVTMSWGGPGNIRIMGIAGVTAFDKDDIQPGDLVTQCGYDGSQTDAVWDIYQAGTTNKIGQSSFALACSDAAMNGPDDCFLPAGDNDGVAVCHLDDNTVVACTSTWVYEGMSGNGKTLDCNSLANASASQESCAIPAGASQATHHYTVYVDGKWESAVARINLNTPLTDDGGQACGTAAR